MQVSTQVGSAVGILLGPRSADGRKGRVLQVDSALGRSFNKASLAVQLGLSGDLPRM